jgi:CRP-like cAMP-binding protein
MNRLIDDIKKVAPLDPTTESIIIGKFKVESLKKGKIILKENIVCNKMWFIESGTIRQYMLIDGVDITKWFYVDNQWVTSQYSYFEQKPAYDYLQAYEDTIVYSITNDDEKDLLDYPQYLKYHVSLLRHYLASLNYFMRNYKQMTADEKYKFFLDNHPEVIQRVKLKQLASLIGISQETLSRIRARLK